MRPPPAAKGVIVPLVTANLRALIIGVASGFFGSLVGLGGGVVLIPLLTMWAGLQQHRAHATSLVAVVFTGILGGAAYATGNAVDWRLSIYIAAAATLMAIGAVVYSARVLVGFLKKLFGGLLIVTAISLPLGAEFVGAGLTGSMRVPAALLLGALSGSLTGLLGIGGGSLIVPMLVLVFGLDQHTAQGTSLAVMIPAGIAGTIVHLANRRVETNIVVALVAGVAVGAFTGGRSALFVPELPLQLLFAALLLWTGYRYLVPKRPKAIAPESNVVTVLDESELQDHFGEGEDE